MNNFKEGGFKKKRGDFGHTSNFGGNRERRSGGSFGGGDRGRQSRGEQEMFTTTCAMCHKSCEVPFRPNGEKPVYCRECFGKKNNEEFRGGRNDSRSGYRGRDEAPRGRVAYAKPQPTSAPHETHGNDIADIKRQLTTIESRLNRILDLIKPPVPKEMTPMTKETKVQEVVAEVVAPSKKKESKTKEATKVVKAKAVPAKKAQKKVVKKNTK